MQHNDLNKYLFDILQAIDAIEFAKKQISSFEEFYTNRLIRSSIERELITVGEIATILRKEFPEAAISDLKKIAATRNIIVHDYDGVNYKVIWSIIETHLAQLKKEVETLLKNSNS